MNAVCCSYDIAVIGGGPAGLACAITAARAGKRVGLFEMNSFLGGAMAIGLSPLGFLAQDAGVGAALAQESKITPAQVDVNEVRSILLRQDAILNMEQ